jgi:hypothetical protein
VVGLEDRGPSRQLVELTCDGVDLVDVGVEDHLEAAAAIATRDAREPLREATDPAPLDDDDHEQDGQADGQPADEGADVGLDERVEIDRMVLRRGSAGV